jgi:hypothetical protein
LRRQRGQGAIPRVLRGLDPEKPDERRLILLLLKRDELDDTVPLVRETACIETGAAPRPVTAQVWTAGTHRVGKQ